MLKVGIIGAGRLGNVHADNLAKIEDVKLEAVYDIAEQPARTMSEKFGPVICNSAEELAARVDVVVVASPSDCHIEGVRAAVQAGKAVFTEKPFCRRQDQLEDYRELLKGFDKTFGIGFVRRHMLKTQMVKKMLDDGKIGRIRYCNIDLPFGAFRRMYGDWFADYSRSGGVILDMLAHHIDLCCWFFGRPKRVYAQSMMLDPAQTLPSDYVSSTVTFENGVIVNFMCAWQRFGRSGERMEIYGEKGAITMTGEEAVGFAELDKEPVMLNAAELASGSGVSNVNVGNGFLLEMQNFTRAVRDNSAFAPGIPEAYASFELAEAMMRSAETNKLIEL